MGAFQLNGPVMAKPSSTTAGRGRLLNSLFPDGVPRLWCPLLTHYDIKGAINIQRMAEHLAHISPHVQGFLLPGSTGDGWELTAPETQQLLEFAFDQAQKLNLHLLIGALKHKTEEALDMINAAMDRIKARTWEGNSHAALIKARVTGFTVCPPRGKDLRQDEIRFALESILATGLPIAIYQLPQITQNEISPETAVELAAHHENFVLLKDTSGTDRIIGSGKDLGGVFTLRGAEGGYAQWLKAAAGPYDGFLLSTANCFAREYSQLIHDLSARRFAAACQMSDRLTAAVNETFKAVQHLQMGNPFANANKAMDHCLAYGAKALSTPSPRLHGGVPLPPEIVRTTSEVLSRQRFFPTKGYLE
jgi:4-hydroxy-tetrahydrodipicolinate synthase